MESRTTRPWDRPCRAGTPAVLAVMPGGDRKAWPDYMPRPDLKIDLPVTAEIDQSAVPSCGGGRRGGGVGHVVGPPDADGVFRRISPFRRFDGVSIPTLGLAACLSGEGVLPWLMAQTANDPAGTKCPRHGQSSNSCL